MRLRAVEIRNWACIGSLRLTDLSDGIIILHGPNRTGKSSLAQAIRSGLFDHNHDSAQADLVANIPWKTKAVPHVAIEFEHESHRYRISKTFARTKEGQASLEKHTGQGWVTQERNKEAAKKVRELIGVDSSDAGIFQMLWLHQGSFDLPAPNNIDPGLEKSLEAILGTLITGPDLDFKARIDLACGRWFTAMGREKKDSPVTLLTAALEKATQEKAEIDRQRDLAANCVQQYDDARARQPDLAHSLVEAQVELERVQKQREGVRHRIAQHEAAAKIHQNCESLYQEARRRLDDFDGDARRLESSQKEYEQEQANLQAIEEKRKHADATAQSARVAQQSAERELAEHQQGRASLEDRQRLVTNRLEDQALQERLRQATELERQRHDLEQKLVGPRVLAEAEIQTLRQNRIQAARMLARLEAEEIHVSVQATGPIHLEVACDDQTGQSARLMEKQERRWLVRQQAEFHLGDLAIVRIYRGEEDRDLDTLARELAELERHYREALTAAEIDPADANALDRLTERRLHHAQFTTELQTARRTLGTLAPDGIPALLAQLQQKAVERELVIKRRPELADWLPDPIVVEHLQTDFQELERGLQSRAQDASRLAQQLADQAKQHQDAVHKLRESLAALDGQIKSLQEKLGRHDRAALAWDVEQTHARLMEAEAKLKETTLTEAEQAIESGFERTRAACEVRARRARENEDLLLRLHTQLSGTEGLHQKRIQAEQTVNDLTRALQREQTLASAHKRLKDLFEEIRQEKVRRTVGPINDRVLQWARHLGINDYASLSFDNSLLPKDLIPHDAVEGSTVKMDRESLGTMEQLSLLIRLAVGGLLAKAEPAVAILDDPLAHADPAKHRKMLEILARAARGEQHGPNPTGPLQLIILTCHADRFDHLEGAQHIDLAAAIRRGG